MKAALKTAVVVVPFLVVFVTIRACAGGAAGRWQSRMEEYDPGARVVIDRDELIVVAADVDTGLLIGEEAQRFRAAIIEEYGDLLGRGREQRMVVLLFSSLERLRAFADGPDPKNVGRAQNLHGFTRASRNAIFLPPEPSFKTMRHELVHLVMEESQGAEGRFSPWLGEGLAQLFEAYDPQAVPPTPPGIDLESRVFISRVVGETFDVQRLLELQDYAIFTGENGHRNYAEALVLVSFLFERYSREQFQDYIAYERAWKQGRAEAFARIYKYGEPGFMADLAEFLRRLRQGHR